MFYFTCFQILSCSTVETISEQKQYNITLDNNSNDSLKLFVIQEAGKYVETLPVENIYLVKIPEMRGGYSKFFGIKLNKHIPEKYSAIKIIKGEKTIKEFSIMKVEQLKTDSKGNYIMTY